MANRDKEVYFAKLAEQAERYDEMANHMENVGKHLDELSVEERNLLSVAYKNAVGSRRAAWRIITSVEQKEKSRGDEEQAKYAKVYGWSRKGGSLITTFSISQKEVRPKRRFGTPEIEKNVFMLSLWIY